MNIFTFMTSVTHFSMQIPGVMMLFACSDNDKNYTTVKMMVPSILLIG